MADRNFSTRLIVTETGANDAITGNSVNGDSIKGVSSGSGAAVHGNATGTGKAGYFEAANSNDTLYAINSSTGNGLHAVHSGSSGDAIYAENSNGANTQPTIQAYHGRAASVAIQATNTATDGKAASFTGKVAISAPTSPTTDILSVTGSGSIAAVTGTTAGTGKAVNGTHTASSGVGYGTYGQSASASGYGVYGSNSSTGYAGYFDNKVSFQKNLETVDGYGLVFPNSSSGFPTGNAGQLYYHPTFKALFVYDGSNWIQQTIPVVTGFPGSPATNLVVYRSDRGLEYYYDGTRWLTTTQYEIAIPFSPGAAAFPWTAATNLTYLAYPADSSIDIYVEKINFSTYQNTTFDSTHNWTMSVTRQDSSNATSTVGSTTNWTTGRSAAIFYLDVVTVNAQYTSSQARVFYATYTPSVPAPGSVYVGQPSLTFRKVG